MERRQYEDEMKAERDRIAQLAIARNKGIQEGIEQNAFEMAWKLKAQGVDTAIIAESSGLSLETIETL